MSDENLENLNEDGSDGASSQDVKDGVTPETHFKDEKGVPYYNRYREMESKYKDVDLDLYKRAKDLDLEAAEDALDFKKQIYSDPKKLEKVLALLNEKSQELGDKAKANPELQAVLQELNGIKAQLQAKEQSSWMSDYDSKVSNAITELLSGEELKAIGKLSEFEQKAVEKLVDDIFESDAKSRASKLSKSDIPSVVQGVLKMVLDNRKGSLGGMLKRDLSPDPLKGSGKTGDSKKPMTEEERMESMTKYMQEARAGNSPA